MRKVTVIESVVSEQEWELTLPDSAPPVGLDLIEWLKVNDVEQRLISSYDETVDLNFKEIRNG